MGIFDGIRNADLYAENSRLVQENYRLGEQLYELSSDVRELEEDMLKIADAFDGVGWAPLPGNESQEISLATVKKASEVGRAMYTLNPFVKRGVDARITYIWGKGVGFDGVDDIASELNLNRKKLFNPQTYEELERALATDGNVFTALPFGEARASKKTAFRIQLKEIAGSVSDPEDKEEIWLYKRQWTVTLSNSRGGEPQEKPREEYYMSLPYYRQLKATNKPIPKTWRGVKVNQNFVLHHMAVNRQVGWRWGVPDTMAIVFWAKAYKEYLEDNALLVKAYSRIAWQVNVPNRNAGIAAAAQVMQAPQRDPITGEFNDVGATVFNTGNNTITPAANNASTVDFDKGQALAAAVAAGLGLPKHIVTSDAGSGNRATAETLDLPTLKTMESRQLLHSERFYDVFEFFGAKISPLKLSTTVDIQEAEGVKADHATVTWPQIESETTKDRMAALGIAVELGTLYKEEMRKEALETFNIAPYRPYYDLPDPAEDPQNKYNEERDIRNMERSVVPSQGNSGGISAQGGALSTKNSARDNRAEDEGK